MFIGFLLDQFHGASVLVQIHHVSINRTCSQVLNLQYVGVAIKYYYWILEIIYTHAQNTTRGDTGYVGGAFQGERHLMQLEIEQLPEQTATPVILLLSPEFADFPHAYPGQSGRT